MNTDAIRENLKRGTIDLLLLSLLRHSDKYGYELKNELYERSLNKYELKEACIPHYIDLLIMAILQTMK